MKRNVPMVVLFFRVELPENLATFMHLDEGRIVGRKEVLTLASR